MSSSIRADASRNRETLIAVATRAFANSEEEPSMRAIAREAGVGVGTLYRHFSTRESLVEAVYRDQLRRLGLGSQELLNAFPPAEAMRRWMDLFAEWIATKHGMAKTVQTLISTGEISFTQSRAELLAAIAAILDAGCAAGDIRSDYTAEEVATSLAGVFMVVGSPDQTRRQLDLLMDGLRPRLI